MSRSARRPKGGSAKRGGSGRLAALGAAQVAELLLWLLVVAVPLVVVPTARDAFDLPKQLVGGGIALTSLVVLAFAAARGGGLRLGAAGLAAAWRRPVVRAVLPLTAAALLSIAFGGHPEHSRAALPLLLLAVASLVGWSLALPSERICRPLAGMLLPAGLLALLAVLQFHDLFRPFDFLGSEGATARFGISSLAGNAGHLAAWLALACVIGQVWLGLRPAGKRWAGQVAALALSVYAIAATQTLAALAALAAGSAAVWWWRLPRRRALAGLAGVVVLATLLVVAVAPLRERVGDAVSELSEGEVNELLTGRLDAWRAALHMAGEHPVTGVGHGAYLAEYSDAKLDLLDAGVPFYREHRQPTFSEAHSEPLQVVAEWGLVGLAALVWALWVVLGAAWRVGRASRESGNGQEAAQAWGGLAVLAVLALVHFPFRLALTGFPALLFLAWLLRRADELGGGAEAEGDVEGEGEAGGGRAARLAAWGLTLLAVAGLVGWIVHARGELRASRIQKAVEEVSRQLVARGGAPNQVLWAHLRVLREAEELTPEEAGLPLAAGSQYLLLGRPDEAIEQYRRAVELEPRPEGWLNLGRAQWAAGDRDAAIDSWVKAVRLHRPLRRHVPPEARSEVTAQIPEAER
ncbi:MAG TPA: O-antigen ligase family protein [Thermoanaerobaculia bacterium]|nr:O-antigen ligase family protein [Thermoanaerobaculia bacterium]